MSGTIRNPHKRGGKPHITTVDLRELLMLQHGFRRQAERLSSLAAEIREGR